MLLWSTEVDALKLELEAAHQRTMRWMVLAALVGLLVGLLVGAAI